MRTKDMVVGSAGRGRLLFILVAALSGSACSLIKVNGKPLGGGGTSSGGSTSASNDSSSSSSSSDGAGQWHEPEHTADKPEPLADDEMEVVKPEGMDDAAEFKPGRIPWCPPGKWNREVWDKGRMRRALTSGWSHGSPPDAEAMEQVCQWADDRSWQKQSTYLVQVVMNSEHVSQADAVEKIKKWVAANQKARANEGKEPTDEDRFAWSESDFTVEKPGTGVATAKIGASIPWCDVAPKSFSDKWKPSRIGRTISNQYAGSAGTAEGALHLCQRPNDATWKTEAQYVLQRWMNWTKQSQDEAVASLRARIIADKFEGERQALCKALEVSPETGGEAKAYAVAHQSFFGCNEHKQTLWEGGRAEAGVGFYFDGDDHLESEIIRLTWLFDQVRDPDNFENGLPSKNASANRPLLDYAVAAPDFAAIDTKALAEMTKKAPFSSGYAKAVINESVATLKWRKKLYDEYTATMLKQGGDDYAAILRDAPKKGFQEWQKVSASWKAELERSRAFEKKLGNPSRKVLAGCAAELTPDVAKLFKSYKKTDYNEVLNAVTGDPIAQLLLSRLAICYAYEKVGGSGVLKDLVEKGRDYRGPRSMAYYAILDAVSEAKNDRPNLLLSTDGFSFETWKLTSQYSRDFNFDGRVPWRPEDGNDKGVVAELKKTGDGLQIVFKKTKVTFPEYNCRSTRKITRIREDGTLEYEQDCRPTGKTVTEDTTPEPHSIATNQGAGVTPGVYVVTSDKVVPFTKKNPNDKKILTFFGWEL